MSYTRVPQPRRARGMGGTDELVEDGALGEGGGMSQAQYRERMVAFRDEELRLQRREALWNALTAVATAAIPLATFFGIAGWQDLQRRRRTQGG